jgi:hypothetical protein
MTEGESMTYTEAKEQLLAEVCREKGKPRDQLKPWVDYDPPSIDEEAYHLAKGSSGTRWTGD